MADHVGAHPGRSCSPTVERSRRTAAARRGWFDRCLPASRPARSGTVYQARSVRRFRNPARVVERLEDMSPHSRRCTLATRDLRCVNLPLPSPNAAARSPRRTAWVRSSSRTATRARSHPRWDANCASHSEGVAICTPIPPHDSCYRLQLSSTMPHVSGPAATRPTFGAGNAGAAFVMQAGCSG